MQIFQGRTSFWNKSKPVEVWAPNFLSKFPDSVAFLSGFYIALRLSIVQAHRQKHWPSHHDGDFWTDVKAQIFMTKICKTNSNLNSQPLSTRGCNKWKPGISTAG